MALIREINVNIVTPAGSGKQMVTYWNDVHPIGVQRAALRALLEAVKSTLGTAITFSYPNTGRVLNDATGTLTGIWNDSALANTVGTQGSALVPDAAQILWRWTTGVIINGRFIAGRQFVPGLTSTGLAGGNIVAATVGVHDAALATFIATNVGFGVWHRPVGGAGGQHVIANGASTWPEMAVLRRRRG